jgi:hypothetical protein
MHDNFMTKSGGRRLGRKVVHVKFGSAPVPIYQGTPRQYAVHGFVLPERALGCDLFEVVVMKRADSPYPVQLRSATEEFRGWVKHRFLI